MRHEYASPNYIKAIKGNEMGGVLSTHGRDEKCVQNVGRKI
jgi:hypothetical protein